MAELTAVVRDGGRHRESLADNTLPVKTANTGLTVNNATATNQATGGGGAHNNLQPYFVVYFWERTA